MQPIPIRVLVKALVCLSVVSAVAATPSPRQSGSTAIGPVGNLNIVNKDIAPDGFTRSTVLAGGTFPGPLIKGNKGDDFKINLINLLNDSSMETNTSVHFHGIFQHGSNWADGVAGVTQCPIQPYRSFLHQFDALNQTGTYWYHSHVSSQYCDGLRGPVVLYDPDDPHKDLYDVDDTSTVITLADWYHEASPTLTHGPYASNATLVNGLGRYAGGPSTPLSVFTVEEGKRYRFRLVGASCDAAFNFSIDGHSMTVIETDGNEIQPVVVDSLEVYPGQRYSVVVTANQTVGNFWIRAISNNLYQLFNGSEDTAILRYVGAPVEDPTTTAGPHVAAYSEADAIPLIDPGAPGVPIPGKADVNILLVPGLTVTPAREIFTINGAPFVDPSQPVLLQMLSGVPPSQLLPNGSFYQLPPGKVVEVSMPATDLSPGGARGPHVVHLHGHAFDVIRVPGSSTYNFVNPVRRDTISIGFQANNDNLTFRFTTDNPGPWFLHCHTDFHLRDGFAAVMAEDLSDATVQEKQVIPEYWYDLCK